MTASKANSESAETTHKLLSAEQIEEFDRLGILRLQEAVARTEAERMCESVWEALASRLQIRRDSPTTWQGRRIAGAHWLPKWLTFNQIGSPLVRCVLDDLFGVGSWQKPQQWGVLFVTFPDRRGDWDVPNQWHFDYPVMPTTQGMFAGRFFTCLADASPEGGATLVVTGSHKLAQRLMGKGGQERFRPKEMRTALIKDFEWVRALCSRDGGLDRVDRFMRTSTVIDDVELRVEEMTGKAGDVILMHPLTMHAISRNCGDTPRIAVSTTILRQGWRHADFER